MLPHSSGRCGLPAVYLEGDDVAAGKRIIGGFFLMMMGFGIILDTTWLTVGSVTAGSGAVLVLWGAGARR